MVVTPTPKAAKAAATEIGAATGSAARLAYQYGWRWDDDGAWTRLTPGDSDPVTGRRYPGPADDSRLRPGDLLVIDEAGMADQDTARALLTIADECRVRVALLGDSHQLPAVGRGGVLDLAIKAADPAAHLTLDSVHRFISTDETGRPAPDTGYAELTLAMRTGTDPGTVFDALLARGQVRLHADTDALREALAETAAGSYAAGEPPAIVVDTREQAAEFNAAIRQRLVAAGRVHDRRVVVTAAGQRIGVGDRIATRRNDRDLQVANRDSWIVTAVGRRGGLLVTPAPRALSGAVTPADPGPRVLPEGYVTAHVELGYATTAHGAQGETVSTSHLVIGEHTGASAAYVGMTRGRQTNVAHMVATDPAEARVQWGVVFARDRADLGPAHAARQAAAEAARYAQPRPPEHVPAELEAESDAERNAGRTRRDVARQAARITAGPTTASGRTVLSPRPTALPVAGSRGEPDVAARRIGGSPTGGAPEIGWRLPEEPRGRVL